jgi:glycosyltransferase involved in cell wall biosynthesis
MTRVMHVLAPSAVGGLERMVQTLAAAQRADDAFEDVRVLALLRQGEPVGDGFAAPLRAQGVTVHTVSAPARAYATERAAIEAHCTTYRPQVVHSHGAHADVVTTGTGRAIGAASVTTMHGLAGGGLLNRGYEWLQRRSCRRKDAVVAVARPLAKRLVDDGIPAERMHVVRNAWRPAAPPLSRQEARRVLGLPESRFVVGWVGRVSREKGLDVLLEAFPALASYCCHLAVIGDGQERPALARRVLELGLGAKHSVSWHGEVPDASRLLPAFDVLVISSRTEGTPMVLLEAMAAHVPVIATRVGGIPDVIGEDEALLVPSEDPRALAQAICTVQRDTFAARQRATDAHARVQRESDLSRWVARYRYVYEAAMGGVRG